jgi:hypothetical protein
MARLRRLTAEMINVSPSVRANCVDETTALDAASDVLDTHATGCDASIGGFLCPCERPTLRLLGGHDDLDVVQRKGQAAEILE